MSTEVKRLRTGENKGPRGEGISPNQKGVSPGLREALAKVLPAPERAVTKAGTETFPDQKSAPKEVVGGLGKELTEEINQSSQRLPLAERLREQLGGGQKRASAEVVEGLKEI